MQSEKMTRRSSLMLAALLWLCGCTTTVTPVKVAPSVASFDGANQTSGVLTFNRTNHVGIVTAAWRTRYDILVEDYAKRFIPPLVADYGLSANADGTWTATAEAFVNMGKMELWRRSGIK